MQNLTIEEQTNVLKTKRVLSNAVVLSNIVELSVSVVRSMGGKDVAESIGDTGTSRTVLSNIVANRIREKLAL